MSDVFSRTSLVLTESASEAVTRAVQRSAAACAMGGCAYCRYPAVWIRCIRTQSSVDSIRNKYFPLVHVRSVVAEPSCTGLRRRRGQIMPQASFTRLPITGRVARFFTRRDGGAALLRLLYGTYVQGAASCMAGLALKSAAFQPMLRRSNWCLWEISRITCEWQRAHRCNPRQITRIHAPRRSQLDARCAILLGGAGNEISDGAAIKD